jgi:hypothetical protein
VIVPGAPAWFSDSPYLKASVTAGLFCDNALVRWSSLVGGSSAIAGGALPPSGWSPLEYSEDLMPSFGRTRALGAAASVGDTAITAGGTIAAAEATCRALCWGAAPRQISKRTHLGVRSSGLFGRVNHFNNCAPGGRQGVVGESPIR